MFYTLMSSARNEEAFIEKTIQAVISQTILPLKWIIVNDGSTDRTEEIIAGYAKEYSFIELVCRENEDSRNFGSKALALQEAYKKLSVLDFQFVGNLDADISFPPNYFERMLEKFSLNENLGICGGTRLDIYNGKFIRIRRSSNSVAGAFQFFRRSCYEQIGGYVPLEKGGIDMVAETMARMKGWQVRSYTEEVIYHYRRTGTASQNIFKASFKGGVTDYVHGYHPLFQIARGFPRMITKRPLFISSIIRTCGYLWAYFNKYNIEVPDDFVKFLRNEQMNRLKTASNKILKLKFR